MKNAILFEIFLIILNLMLIKSYYNFEGYRLIQYDKEGKNFGCRKTSLNSPLRILNKQNKTGEITSDSLLGKLKTFSRDFVLIKIGKKLF
jgi:hypothetical protein